MRLRRLLVVFLLLTASRTPHAAAQEEAGTLMQQVRPLLEPKLGDALEHAPNNLEVPWADDPSGLSGAINAAPTTFDGVGGDAAGRLCRAFRYTVDGLARRLAVEGQRCRTPDGAWGAGGVADQVLVAPETSPLVRDIAVNLKRLAYYSGDTDGVAGPDFIRALLHFEHDEQVAPEAEATPGLLELSNAAIARIPSGGGCDDGDATPGAALACGRVR